MILGVDHVGLRTDDPAAAAPFLSALGLRSVDSGAAADFGVDCEFWARDESSTAVELVSPVDERSAVHDQLVRNGPGLYHLAFEVDALEADVAGLRERGFTLVTGRPCAGAREGMRVAFLYARRPLGLLVELVQYDRPPSHSRLVDRLADS
jgi:methylmalonyl-CoA/ethylmalonyl-CoA epimerase